MGNTLLFPRVVYNDGDNIGSYAMTPPLEPPTTSDGTTDYTLKTTGNKYELVNRLYNAYTGLEYCINNDFTFHHSQEQDSAGNIWACGLNNVDTSLNLDYNAIPFNIVLVNSFQSA